MCLGGFKPTRSLETTVISVLLDPGKPKAKF